MSGLILQNLRYDLNIGIVEMRSPLQQKNVRSQNNNETQNHHHRDVIVFSMIETGSSSDSEEGGHDVPDVSFFWTFRKKVGGH